MGRSLTDLADVCRAAGLKVIEVSGWQTRGRGGSGGAATGGYEDGRPSAIMMHHTASKTKPINDVMYMTFNATFAPIANLGLDRTGRVWVMAGRATNTNGSGQALPGVPANSANSHAIGIEAFNDGIGESWPVVQQQAYVTLVAALCRPYKIPPAHVHAHFEYAPNRKVDPLGPSRWGPGKWNMDLFRSDVTTKLDTPGDDMAKMRVLRFRFDGYKEQLIAFHTSGDTLRQTEMIDAPCVVLPKPSNALRQQIEAELGHKLDPT